jgi:hypothetical protein
LLLLKAMLALKHAGRSMLRGPVSKPGMFLQAAHLQQTRDITALIMGAPGTDQFVLAFSQLLVFLQHSALPLWMIDDGKRLCLSARAECCDWNSDCLCLNAGSGKELIAAKLQRELSFTRISPEQLLREQIKKTSLGLQAEKWVPLILTVFVFIKQLCTFLENSWHQA